MDLQQTITFPTVHLFENNAASQCHLDDNRVHFSKQCLKVFDWLMTGEGLTVLWAANNGVASLPRRIKDLKACGVLIDDSWSFAMCAKVKYYYMTKEQIEFNKKFKV